MKISVDIEIVLSKESGDYDDYQIRKAFVLPTQAYFVKTIVKHLEQMTSHEVIQALYDGIQEYERRTASERVRQDNAHTLEDSRYKSLLTAMQYIVKEVGEAPPIYYADRMRKIALRALVDAGIVDETSKSD